MNLPRPEHISPEQWDRAKGYTRRLAYRYRNNAPWWIDPEDFVSEAWLMLWKAAETYDPASRRGFTSYAHQRVRGRMIDLLREGSPIPRTRFASGEEPPPPPLPLEMVWHQPQPAEAEPAVSEELVSQLPGLLARLPVPEREAVIRIELEGQWASDIARELGCDPRVVRNRRKRGIEELQRLAAAL